MRFINNDIYVNVSLKGLTFKAPSASLSNAITNAIINNVLQDGIYQARLDPIKKRFLPVKRIE